MEKDIDRQPTWVRQIALEHCYVDFQMRRFLQDTIFLGLLKELEKTELKGMITFRDKKEDSKFDEDKKRETSSEDGGSVTESYCGESEDDDFISDEDEDEVEVKQDNKDKIKTGKKRKIGTSPIYHLGNGALGDYIGTSEEREAAEKIVMQRITDEKIAKIAQAIWAATEKNSAKIAEKFQKYQPEFEVYKKKVAAYQQQIIDSFSEQDIQNNIKFINEVSEKASGEPFLRYKDYQYQPLTDDKTAKFDEISLNNNSKVYTGIGEGRAKIYHPLEDRVGVIENVNFHSDWENNIPELLTLVFQKLGLACCLQGDISTSSGSTMTMVIRTEKEIWTGWVGDSPVVALEKEQNGAVAHPLTWSHICGGEEGAREKPRVTAENGDIYFGRLDGNLEVTRSMGDRKFAGISDIPSISVYKIKPDSKILVAMGSDGLSNYLSLKQMVEMFKTVPIKNLAQSYYNTAWSNIFTVVDESGFEVEHLNHDNICLLLAEGPGIFYVLDGHSTPAIVEFINQQLPVVFKQTAGQSRAHAFKPQITEFLQGHKENEVSRVTKILSTFGTHKTTSLPPQSLGWFSTFFDKTYGGRKESTPRALKDSNSNSNCNSRYFLFYNPTTPKKDEHPNEKLSAWLKNVFEYVPIETKWAPLQDKVIEAIAMWKEVSWSVLLETEKLEQTFFVGMLKNHFVSELFKIAQEVPANRRGSRFYNYLVEKIYSCIFPVHKIIDQWYAEKKSGWIKWPNRTEGEIGKFGEFVSSKLEAYMKEHKQEIDGSVIQLKYILDKYKKDLSPQKG